MTTEIKLRKQGIKEWIMAGIREGIREGIRGGIKEGKIKDARKMLENGVV